METVCEKCNSALVIDDDYLVHGGGEFICSSCGYRLTLTQSPKSKERPAAATDLPPSVPFGELSVLDEEDSGARLEINLGSDSSVTAPEEFGARTAPLLQSAPLDIDRSRVRSPVLDEGRAKPQAVRDAPRSPPRPAAPEKSSTKKRPSLLGRRGVVPEFSKPFVPSPASKRSFFRNLAVTTGLFAFMVVALLYQLHAHVSGQAGGLLNALVYQFLRR